MSELTLFCLVKGKVPENTFKVTINKNDSIIDLKEVIKEKKKNEFNNVDANDLTLWKVNTPISEKKKFERLKDQVTINTAVKEILGGVKIEDVTKTVGTVFKDLPNEKNIHIVVEAPPVQDQLMHDLIKQLDTTHLDHDQSSQEKTKPPERSLLHRAFRKHVHIGNEIRDFNKKEEVIGIITEEGGAPRIKCVKDEKSYSTFNAFFMAHFGERPRQNYRDKIRIVNYISYEELSDLYENSQKEKEQEKK